MRFKNLPQIIFSIYIIKTNGWRSNATCRVSFAYARNSRPLNWFHIQTNLGKWCKYMGEYSPENGGILINRLVSEPFLMRHH